MVCFLWNTSLVHCTTRCVLLMCLRVCTHYCCHPFAVCIQFINTTVLIVDPVTVYLTINNTQCFLVFRFAVPFTFAKIHLPKFSLIYRS